MPLSVWQGRSGTAFPLSQLWVGISAPPLNYNAHTLHLPLLSEHQGRMSTTTDPKLEQEIFDAYSRM